MVRRIGALLGFANTRDSELLVFGQNVLERLFENPAYPKPPLKKETFKTLLDSYGAAITAALDGSKQAIAERNGLRAEVIHALRQLGHYAQYTCNDDMPTFISSGFQPAFVARVTSQPLAQPFISNINHGKSGELFVQITPVQRARNYQLRYGTQGPDGMEPNSWTIRTVPTARFPISVDGLTPGKAYVFQVRAYGKLGYTDWSSSVSRFCA